MTTSAIETLPPWAQGARIEPDLLVVDLLDGRVLSVPLAWFPRLLAGTHQGRQNWRLIGRGAGISWPALDEDIRVASLPAGQASTESQASLKQWLASRAG